jgi:hypothetical protein
MFRDIQHGKQAAAVLMLALGAGFAIGAPASATHLGYKPCPDMTFHRATVKHVKSNFGCRGARRVLRRLLARGIGGLPKPTKKVGRWGCTNAGYQHFYACERHRSDSRALPGIVFAVRPRRR